MLGFVWIFPVYFDFTTIWNAIVAENCKHSLLALIQKGFGIQMRKGRNGLCKDVYIHGLLIQISLKRTRNCFSPGRFLPEICQGETGIFCPSLQIVFSLLVFLLGTSFVIPFSHREAAENSLAELLCPWRPILTHKIKPDPVYRFSMSFHSHYTLKTWLLMMLLPGHFCIDNCLCETLYLQGG